MLTYTPSINFNIVQWIQQDLKVHDLGQGTPIIRATLFSTSLRLVSDD